MNSTYAQKSSTVQKAADSKAASVLDSSAQGESLQRKADMVNNAAQRAVQRKSGVVQTVRLETSKYKSCFQDANACVGTPTVEGDANPNAYYSTLSGNNKLYNTDVDAKNAAKMVAKGESRHELLEDGRMGSVVLADETNSSASGPETLDVALYEYVNELGELASKYVGYGYAYHAMDSTNEIWKVGRNPTIACHYHAIKRDLELKNGKFQKKETKYTKLGVTEHYLVKPF